MSDLLWWLSGYISAHVIWIIVIVIIYLIEERKDHGK